MPVGTYYSGSGNGLNALVMSDFDRAATRGTGAVKVGGNYGADLLPNSICKERGYDTCLYVDSPTQSFIEEFSVANFAAITDSGAYVTPKSTSVLPSITNTTLMQLARDSGLEVEQRPVAVSELDTLKEVAAIGTAVVVNPIGSITMGDKTVEFDYPATLVALKNEVRRAGPSRHHTCLRLTTTCFGPLCARARQLVKIQTGDRPDPRNWLLSVP